MHNYSPLDSNNDLQVFSLTRTTTWMDLIVLLKIQFLEIICIIMINGHLTLIDSSKTKWCVIIFGAKFSDKCSFHLDWDFNQVKWMEYEVPHHVTTSLFTWF